MRGVLFHCLFLPTALTANGRLAIYRFRYHLLSATSSAISKRRLSPPRGRDAGAAAASLTSAPGATLGRDIGRAMIDTAKMLLIT